LARVTDFENRGDLFGIARTYQKFGFDAAVPQVSGAFAHGGAFEHALLTHNGAQFGSEISLRHAAAKVTRNAGSRQNGDSCDVLQ
jgi:hypothetical protein